MSEGKPKTHPIRAKCIYFGGSTIVEVGLEDFIDLVTEKSLPVIHTPVLESRKAKDFWFVYFAVDTSFTYYTVSTELVDELPVSIFSERIWGEQRFGSMFRNSLKEVRK